MRTFSVVIIAVMFFGCTSQPPAPINDRNVMVDDDSLFQLHLPTSILDTAEIDTQIFGSHGYALMYHYGYWYFNTQNQRSNVKVLYALDKDADPYTEIVIDQVLKKEIRDIRMSNIETFISSDTLRIGSKKMGIIQKVEGCGDTALYTTSCFVLSPRNDRIYRVIISCDKSDIGNALRDSIPAIVKSFYFKPTQ